jgi:drug/metabolite transporter (DMT)-like permease
MASRDRFELLILGVIWGASFLFTRVAVPEFGAFALVELRIGVAAVFLLGLLAWRGGFAHLRGAAWPMAVVGIFTSALPFVLFAYAVTFLTSGMTAVLNTTTPMFAALVAYFWLNDRLSLARVVGLVIGFAGVVLSAWDKLSLNGGTTTLAVLAALAASLSYGLGMNFTKKKLSHVPPLAAATGSSLAATLMLLPLAAATWPSVSPSLHSWMCVIALGVVCTGIAYVFYFQLIARIGPSKASTSVYLVPVFGMLWGFIFLNEVVTPHMLVACPIIVLGTALASGNLTFGTRRQVPAGASRA